MKPLQSVPSSKQQDSLPIEAGKECAERRLRVAIVGAGAIGQQVIHYLQTQAPHIEVMAVVVSRPRERAVQAGSRNYPATLSVPDEPLDLVVECAGAPAVMQHVVPALRRGIPCLVTSVGALAAQGRLAEIEDAARAGSTFVRLVSGSIGAIDILSAARMEGLEHVEYEGRKPPQAWLDTPGATSVDLAALDAPAVLFDGTARDAAQQYPKNANVAATVALAGRGLDDTRVVLVADPTISVNRHIIRARGAFGSFETVMSNAPMASNPKTSRLAAMSVARAVLDCAALIRV